MEDLPGRGAGWNRRESGCRTGVSLPVPGSAGMSVLSLRPLLRRLCGLFRAGPGFPAGRLAPQNVAGPGNPVGAPGPAGCGAEGPRQRDRRSITVKDLLVDRRSTAQVGTAT